MHCKWNLAGRVLAVLGFLIVFAGAGVPTAHANACCSVTAVNLATGVVTARVNVNGQMFQFRLTNPQLLRSLRVGRGVFADFRTRRVSFDGRTVVGVITIIAAAATTKAPAAQKPAAAQPNSTPAPKPAPVANVGTAAPSGQIVGGSRGTAPQPIQIPQLTFGQPQPLHVSPIPADVLSNRYFRYAALGNLTLVHLHGLDGIKTATGLPQGVRDFLYLHARQLPPAEVDNYIVNVQVAQQWFQAHPEPNFIKQAAEQAMSSDCSSSEGCQVVSTHCLGQAWEHTKCEATRQVDKARKAAQDEWRHLTGQAAQLENQALGCFADQAIGPAGGSFQFSLNPQFPVSFQRSGSTSTSYGKFSGQLSGSATFGVPMHGSFTGQLQAFYIPCLPFAIRPKSVGADGTLSVGGTLDGILTASGQYQESITVPPHGVKIPVYVIPVMLGHVPIAELDASVYLDGTVKLDGQGTVNGHVKLQAEEETAYQFSCDGGGCGKPVIKNVPVPATATESVQLKGRVHLRPAIYAALQLDLDWDLLSARAGPEPYLLGEIYGCEFAGASQSTSGASTTQENHALTADVDWGINLRAEALAGGTKFWGSDTPIKLPDGRPLGGHLLFKPLAPSNALDPAVAGKNQTPIGQPATFNVKMPNCYPYKDQIEYRVQWSGGATETGLGVSSSGPSRSNSRPGSLATLAVSRVSAATNNTTANCMLQSGQADCWTDPLKNLPFTLNWAAPGTYYLTITPLRDQHGRKFDGSAASRVAVTVQ